MCELQRLSLNIHRGLTSHSIFMDIQLLPVLVVIFEIGAVQRQLGYGLTLSTMPRQVVRSNRGERQVENDLLTYRLVEVAMNVFMSANTETGNIFAVTR